MAARRKKSSAKRTTRGKAASAGRGGIPWFATLLFVIVLLQAAWIAGFVYSTGSLLPPGVEVGPMSGPSPESPGWDQEKQMELDNLLIQRKLSQEGSRGSQEAPPAPLYE